MGSTVNETQHHRLCPLTPDISTSDQDALNVFDLSMSICVSLCRVKHARHMTNFSNFLPQVPALVPFTCTHIPC